MSQATHSVTDNNHTIFDVALQWWIYCMNRIPGWVRDVAQDLARIVTPVFEGILEFLRWHKFDPRLRTFG